MLQNDAHIYLDYAATTMIDPIVASTMAEHLKSMHYYGNPSSAHHRHGFLARKLIEEARQSVAELINAESEEIIWTSGATESINLALKGVAHSYKNFGNHIITVETEHKAGLEVCRKLSSEGFRITYLPVDQDGRVDEKILEAAICSETILISVMHVNNETGVIQDIEKFAEIAHRHNVLLHVDAAQSIGKLPIDVKKSKIDLISFCSHKIYGPKGIGALYVRYDPPILIQAEINGGGQENGLRSGTLATHQIVGMSKALKIARENMDMDYKHAALLKDIVLSEMMQIGRVLVNTPKLNSVPNILNICIEGVKNIKLLSQLKNVAISSGSACSTSRDQNGSHVLKAMGLNDERIANSVRISWGRYTTPDDIKSGCAFLKRSIMTLREKNIVL